MGGLVPPGFERRFGSSVPPEAQRPFSLDSAEKKAQEVLLRGGVRMEDFSDLYAPGVISRDKQKVADYKRSFFRQQTDQERQSHKLATVLEAVVHDQVNHNKWFGARTKALRTTEYDDIVNGIDSVLEFAEPSSYMALGVDITYRNDLSGKFRRIKEEIRRGELATVKYLRSSDSTFRGEQKQVPRLVLALDGESVNGLAKAWYENAPGLSANPTRFQLVSELLLQLEVFEEYARRVDQGKLAERYRTSRVIMERIQEEISPKFSNRKHDVTDGSSAELVRGLQNFV